MVFNLFGAQRENATFALFSCRTIAITQFERGKQNIQLIYSARLNYVLSERLRTMVKQINHWSIDRCSCSGYNDFLVVVRLSFCLAGS